MSNARPRIAVAGAGLIGRKHCELISQASFCQLAAIVDPAPAARDVAARFQAPIFANLDDLLAKAKPDGVILATPNNLHVDGAIACLAQNVPVLVEKPVAETFDSALRLVAAEQRSGVPILVGHHRRHNPIVQAARRIVQGREIGDLVAVAALWLLKKPDDYFDVAWRRSPGGGPILINLIHDIDNLRFICGEIVEIGAMVSNNQRRFPVEDSAVVNFRFAQGALGTATLSDATPAPFSWEIASGENPIYPRRDENCYMFAGTRGSLALPRLELWTYAGEASWWRPLTREVVDTPPADPLIRQLQHFAAVIRGDEAPLVTAADAAKTLAVVEAIHTSAQMKRQIIVQTVDRGAS